MKCSLATSAALIAACIATVYCDAQNIGGNWYGKAVDQIIYSGWGRAGTYSKVIDMSSGQCKMEQVSYSGGMSPLDEVSRS